MECSGNENSSRIVVLIKIITLNLWEISLNNLCPIFSSNDLRDGISSAFHHFRVALGRGFAIVHFATYAVHLLSYFTSHRRCKCAFSMRRVSSEQRSKLNYGQILFGIPVEVSWRSPRNLIHMRVLAWDCSKQELARSRRKWSNNWHIWSIDVACTCRHNCCTCIFGLVDRKWRKCCSLSQTTIDEWANHQYRTELKGFRLDWWILYTFILIERHYIIPIHHQRLLQNHKPK